MKQQDKNLATADLLYALRVFAEYSSQVRLVGGIPSDYAIALESIKAAIQTVNKGDK